MPQMFPMSWVLIYFVVLLVFLLISLIMSYQEEAGMLSNAMNKSDCSAVVSNIWLW